ncbi:MAG: flagellar hook-basal body complex protein, partial [Vicinamibacterales bacterium]
NVYTRAGNFTLNSNGKLVTPDGYFVQGYTQINPTTGAIVTTGQPTDITVAAGALRASSATTKFRTASNLSANAAAGDEFTTSVQVTDSLGAQHVATITYTKGAAVGEWTYDITLPAQDMGTVLDVNVATGTLTFDATGALDTVDGAPPADVSVVTPAFANGAAAATWNWDLVDANGVASLTGFAAASATSSISADGSTAGAIDSVSVAPDGSIIATLGTGQSMAVAQLALASFNNPRGLSKLGANKYGETQVAGAANVGVAGVGGRGTLIGSALEQSNVDIAQEFTQMILAQRGYQANSKVITVSDELLVDTLALKR